MSIEIDMEGIETLLENLNKIAVDVGKIEDKALKEGAKTIQKDASNKCPRSTLNKKHLADNIKISRVKKMSGAKAIDVGFTKADNSEFFYAKFIEWGYTRKDGVKVEAQPFLYPAMQEKRNDALNKMKDILKEAIEHG